MAYLLIKCPKCGTENFPEAKHCLNCKRSLETAPITKVSRDGETEVLKRPAMPQPCPACGWVNPSSYEKCSKCHHVLKHELHREKSLKHDHSLDKTTHPHPESEEQSVSAPIVREPLVTAAQLEKRKRTRLRLVLAITIIGFFSLGPIGNWITLASAPSSISQLADEAGLNQNGKLILYRQHPALESDISSSCQTPTDGTYVEQGCYLPQQHNVYIRLFPSSQLEGVEVVTAAHEMLHAAYQELDDNTKATLNKELEQEAIQLHDPDLNARMAEYGKLEPGAYDNELHSILGTEYADLSPDLEAYYAKYFTDRNLVVADNQQAKQIFHNDESQLAQIAGEIDTHRKQATTDYNYSVQAAYNGNQAIDDYDYNLYKNELNTANQLVDQYNSLLGQYNTLVDEYNGKPATQMQTVQPQSR